MVPAQTDGNSPETGAPGQEEEGIEIPVQVRLGCPRPPVNSTQGAWGWGQAGSDSGCLPAAHGRSGNTELCASGPHQRETRTEWKSSATVPPGSVFEGV